jgi:hypothetical protein
VTKKVWDYIKKHDLQDPANRRNINADDKLKAVFGGKAQVSMFEMTKLISGPPEIIRHKKTGNFPVFLYTNSNDNWRKGASWHND